MPDNKVRDLDDKLKSAQKAVNKPAATAKDKADLKLIEDEKRGAELRAKHPPKPPATAAGKEGRLDKALKDTFPGSDPVSMAQAGPPKEPPKK